MGKRLRFIFCFLLSVTAFSSVSADNRVNIDAMPEPNRSELTACTQNLYNFGTLINISRRVKGFSQEDLIEKEHALATRFIEAKCDVIALQELLAPSEQLGEEVLLQLAKMIKERTNRTFDVIVGPTNDKVARVAFLVAKDRAQVVQKLSYSRVELPKISPEQKTRYFVRGPLEVELLVPAREKEKKPKHIVFVTFHFKSRAYNAEDPAGLEWETYRMEMAEALRRIVEGRHKTDYDRGEKLVVLLGDRNSHYDVASAKLLEGTLVLKDFQDTAPCRLSKRGLPLCKFGTSKGQEFFSVLTGDPETKLQPGTYRYKNTYSWLDDILLPHRSLSFVWQDEGVEGNYDSGVIYEPEAASDHALAYVRFNW